LDKVATILLNGVSYSFILFLLASGLSLIFGVMGILNLAHGAFYMIGAYAGLTAVGLWPNFAVGVISSIVAVSIIGFAVDWVFFKRLYHKINEQALLTLGLVYIASNVVLWIWGPYAKMGKAPGFLSGSLTVAGLHFPLYRLAVIVVGLAVFFILWWLQDKTRVGAQVRAGMDDKEMAIGLGVNYGLISSAIFIVGIMMGGFAGYIGAPVIGVQPEISMPILLLAMIVAVVGGLGSIQGALLGSLIIGIVDTVSKSYFPDLSMFTLYVIFIAMLLIRPAGLLGRKRD
jgi:branched-chain amino acid transport system permease protein